MQRIPVLKNKRLKPCILIDEAIPADRNVVQTVEEEKLKYMILYIYIYINQSRYRPGVAQRVPGS
jgi:hypothetical protein